MKRLLAMAIVLLASSAAQAQYQFEYGGRTIRIDPDRGTVSIPGVYDNTGRRSKRARSDSRSNDSKPASQDAKAEPQAAPAPPTSAPAPAPADTAAAPPLAAPPAPPPPAAAATPAQAPVATAPADTAALPPPAAPPAPPPAPTVAAVPTQGPPAVHDSNSPVGVWLTEEKEGKVRIEHCGVNLCGYSVDAKSNANGEQVLINMKPGKDLKWIGRILDPNTGSTYDSTIAMKGPDTLRVQGCAFGGMFCGGQTWSRLN